MSKRLKRPLSAKQIVKRAAAGTAIILVPAIIYLGFLNLKGFYENRMELLAAQISAHRVTVYEAITDIRTGSIITEEMIREKAVLSEQDRQFFMTSAEIGDNALVNIPKGTQVLKNMVGSEDTENRRELEFSLNLASENVKEGDYTDIRIRYPDGEDYIVISKVYISYIDEILGYLYLSLSPEEILLISSALVDCYLNNGSYLYSAKYIASAYQQPSKVTYIPNAAVSELLKTDPNIYKAAKDYLNTGNRTILEDRLQEYYDKYRNMETDVSSKGDVYTGESNENGTENIIGADKGTKSNATDDSSLNYFINEEAVEYAE